MVTTNKEAWAYAAAGNGCSAGARDALKQSTEQKRWTWPARRCFALGLAGRKGVPHRSHDRVLRARAFADRVRSPWILPHRGLQVFCRLLRLLKPSPHTSQAPAIVVGAADSAVTAGVATLLTILLGLLALWDPLACG